MKNKLLLLLLGLLGFTVLSCSRSEYGSPYTTYTVSGKVTDMQGAPIKGITVARYKSDPGISTDEKGDYAFSGEDGWGLELIFTDVDGTQNGGEFVEKIVEVQMTAADKVGKGDGDWYWGDYAKTVNVTLDKKE